MSRPTVTRDGGTWLFTWKDEGYAIGFERVWERREGVFAECVVQAASNGNGAKGGHLVRRTLNLISTRTRTEVANELGRLSDGQIAAETWHDWFEFASETTIEQLRAGAPFVSTFDQPVQLAPQFLISGFLPADETTIINADGGSGKGWFAIALAVALARGQPFLSHLVPACAGKTLYLDYETGQSEFERRQAWIERGLRLWTPADEKRNRTVVQGIVRRYMERPLADDVEQVVAQVRAEHFALVIVDSLAPAAMDQDQYYGATRCMAAFRQIPCTRAVIAHVSKAVATQTTGRGRTLGSVMFENLARSVWEMRREEDGRTVGLFHRKSNIGPPQKDVTYHQAWDDARYTYTMEPTALNYTTPLVQYANLRTRVAAALHEGPQDVRTLATAVGENPNTLRASLNRWPEFRNVADPKGGRSRSGLWTLTDAHTDEDVPQSEMYYDEDGHAVPF